MKDLGINIVGHRRKLLDAIAALPVDAGATTGPSDARPVTDRAAERRHLTLMFCDLVGSTALSARLDAEDLREIIGAYHRTVTETIARFAGYVAKYM